MSSGNSGAVFFLGTRAHYQVLQQPESRYDVENGNVSTETVYQNPSVEQLWPKENNLEVDSTGNFTTGGCSNWAYSDQSELADEHEKLDTTVKRRIRRQSEITLYERDDMKPAQLNSVEDSNTPKSKPSSFLGCLASLARRKPKEDRMEYLQEWNALNTCTYKDSCRCFDCQSRYFECDESEDSSDYEDYSSRCDQVTELAERIALDDDEHELFVEPVPCDTASTDMLIDGDNEEEPPCEHTFDELDLQLEVAAGTPVFLNFLLQHPIHCIIQ